MTITLANAPVTWGVWGPHSLPAHRTSDDILRAVSAAGYGGIELGPIGLFGTTPEEVAARLVPHGLALAGAYVPIRALEGVEKVREDLDYLRAVCDIIATVNPAAPVILAEETFVEVLQHVGRGDSHPELDLADAEWIEFVRIFDQCVAIVRERGLIASYHPHAGTHIEQPHEVDRLLDAMDVGLTLDTGHAAAGGDDPTDLLRRWSTRVNHVHVKDISMSVVRNSAALGTEFSMAEASAPLGAGDLDLDGFLSELRSAKYSGWVVVEQDRHPEGGHDHAMVDLEQANNLGWLRDRASWLGA